MMTGGTTVKKKPTRTEPTGVAKKATAGRMGIGDEGKETRTQERKLRGRAS